jgi:uncharacterized protein (TIGR02271 family)
VERSDGLANARGRAVLDTRAVERMEGLGVVDIDGDKIGTVDEIYVDDDSGAPEFALVKSGLFGVKRRFVPLQGASQDGDELRVAYSRDQFGDAPSLDPDAQLSEADEAELYRHYGLRGGSSAGQSEQDIVAAPGRESKAGAGDAMTRSEEELHLGTQRRDAGRVRLRKYVTTEQVTKTVPVQKEHVRLEREPIADADRGAAGRGPDIAESEHEVTLTEEEPVVEKRVVPKERVRLSKDTETVQREVSEEVRKEQLEVDDPTGKADR